jgi:non-specific serine/threonine protein kinase
MNTAADFGQTLRERRNARSLTQGQLAIRAGLSERTISDLERGVKRPRRATLRALIAALGLTPDEANLFASMKPVESPRRGKISGGPTRSSLPTPLTSFVGRQGELSDIRRLLARARLLTLTGAGGVGKTRLALEAAHVIEGDYQDGVQVVELASLSGPELVLHTVAASLGIVGQPGRGLLKIVTDALVTRRLLLVLDNCEHVIDACAELADRLLSSCPELRILTTSREPLGITGECIWRVPSLSLPTSDCDAQAALIEKSEAVQLFTQRASLATPGFAITQKNASAVARVCLRLDGIPLALELAAARARVLPVAQLAERLDDALRLLTVGSRTAPDRQQTLRATLDWSYGLLSVDEKNLFGRLSVFAGAWTVKAAEAVCADDALQPEHILDLLGRLVDKSLVTVHEEGRHRFLEPIRQYAAERFRMDESAQAIRRAHAMFFLEQAEQIEPDFFGPRLKASFDVLEVELDNIRAALDWSAADPSTAVLGLRLASALFIFWDSRGHLREGNTWLATLLAHSSPSTPTHIRARAIYTRGSFMYLMGETEAAAKLLEESVALWRNVGDETGLAWALWSLGMNARYRNAATALVAAEESLARFHALGGLRPGVPQVQWLLGSLARSRGDYVRASTWFEESLASSRGLDDPWAVAMALRGLGGVRYLKAEFAKAAVLFGQALVAFHEIGNLRMVADGLEGVAAASAASGQAERALKLAGAGFTIRERIGAPLSAEQRALQDRRLTPARQQLSGEAAQAAWRAGQHMTSAAAVAEARDGGSTKAGRAGNGRHSDGLTARERQVVALVAQGYTNRDIAEALVISVATAHRHVANILDKLGLRSRAQVAVWAIDRGLPRGEVHFPGSGANLVQARRTAVETGR